MIVFEPKFQTGRVLNAATMMWESPSGGNPISVEVMDDAGYSLLGMLYACIVGERKDTTK